MVTIADNTVTNSNISKNMGGVSIVGNTFNSLSCSDNPLGVGKLSLSPMDNVQVDFLNLKNHL